MNTSTITFLLSRFMSRDRLLLTKYAICAVGLLVAPLGIVLVFSLVSPDALQAFLFSLGTILVLDCPLAISGWQGWSLLTYWSNKSTYLQGVFPLLEILVCLIAAALPLLGALWLFRHKDY